MHYFNLLFILVLLAVNGAVAIFTVDIKAIRVRFYTDTNCTVPSNWPTRYPKFILNLLCFIYSEYREDVVTQHEFSYTIIKLVNTSYSLFYFFILKNIFLGLINYIYASTDGSCLCYNSHVAPDKDDKACSAGTGILVEDFYNVTLSAGRVCLDNDMENVNSSGLIGVCYTPPRGLPRMGDVVTLHEPLYAWQLFIIGVACLAITISALCVVKHYARKKLPSGNSTFQRLT